MFSWASSFLLERVLFLLNNFFFSLASSFFLDLKRGYFLVYFLFFFYNFPVLVVWTGERHCHSSFYSAFPGNYDLGRECETLVCKNKCGTTSRGWYGVSRNCLQRIKLINQCQAMFTGQFIVSFCLLFRHCHVSVRKSEKLPTLFDLSKLLQTNRPTSLLTSPNGPYLCEPCCRMSLLEWQT